MKIIDSIIKFFKAPKPADLGDVLRMAALHDRNDELNKLRSRLIHEWASVSTTESYVIKVCDEHKLANYKATLLKDADDRKESLDMVIKLINETCAQNLREIAVITRRAGA